MQSLYSGMQIQVSFHGKEQSLGLVWAIHITGETRKQVRDILEKALALLG